MKKRNVWKDIESPLEMHEDERGKITDIFYKKNIEHVAVIDSKSGSLRGNHYHKQTTQHILITKGSLEYWHKPVNSTKEAKCEILNVGDMVSTPPNEIHALKIIEDNQFIVFSSGLRGGKDYESDTFRISPSIIPYKRKEEIDNKNIKLHLGCGKRYLPGFIHIDIDKHPHIDYVHNIKTLPMFEEDSVDEVYSCGVLEYFDRKNEVLEVLREWKRILKPGGTLRLSVPNFESIVKVYEKCKDVESRGILGPIFGRIEVNTVNGIDILHQKTVYDFVSMKRLLESLGFKNIRRYDWEDFLPESYDDYSMAYMPHMDKNGILMALNLECEK